MKKYVIENMVPFQKLKFRIFHSMGNFYAFMCFSEDKRCHLCIFRTEKCLFSLNLIKPSNPL